MSRYHAAHVDASGPGDARPTALQIIEDEGLVGRLADKVFFITGISSGLGIETMRALHATGAHVFGTARDLNRGQEVADEISESQPQGGKITILHMELDSFKSIRAAAQQFLDQSKTLNVLINNAGVMATPQGRTKDGFETQFGTNHLGHFLLFNLLKPTLLSSATPEFPSRVVSVSSIGHRAGSVNFEDYNFEDEYNPWKAYGQSKTANIWFANYIERHYGPQNLHATSVHPGGIATGLQKHLGDDFFKRFEAPEVRASMKSTAQGAATSVYAAVSKEWKDKGGRYLSDCEEQGEYGKQGKPEGRDDGYKPWAYDESGEERLWKDSLRLVGLEDEEET